MKAILVSPTQTPPAPKEPSLPLPPSPLAPEPLTTLPNIVKVQILFKCEEFQDFQIIIPLALDTLLLLEISMDVLY